MQEKNELMRVHVLKHVEFEDLGLISPILEEARASINYTRFYLNEPLPELNSFDALIIMGGPMSANDETKYSWLKDEILFVKKAIAEKKKIFGICLGAQIIAKCLGARVYQNPEKEIGWFPVNFSFSNLIEKSQTVFHWHGETYELPENAKLIATNDVCINQGFLYSEHVLALQFHLEMQLEGINALIDACPDDIEPKSFVQTKDEMISGDRHIGPCKDLLETLLGAFILK